MAKVVRTRSDDILSASDETAKTVSHRPARSTEANTATLTTGDNYDPVDVELGAIMAEAIPQIPSRFSVVRLLGKGGMGVVFECRDTSLGRDVALKVLLPDRLGDASARRRFEREARAAARLRHPRIVTVYELGPEATYIAMELVAGRPLSRVLEEKGPLPASRVREIGQQLAEALSVAHDEGVVHRDVKPGNLIIDESDEVRLADFGIARLVESDATRTRAGTMGTPDYMAPEQLRGGEVGPRADIYAAGATLFECATGARLHKDGVPEAHPYDLVLEATGDQGLANVIARAVSLRPEARYADGSELRAALNGEMTVQALLAKRKRGVLVIGTLATAAAIAYLAARPTEQSASAETSVVADHAKPVFAVLPFKLEGAPSGPSMRTAAGLPSMLDRDIGSSNGASSIGFFRLLDNIRQHDRSSWPATAIRLGASHIVSCTINFRGDEVHVTALVTDASGKTVAQLTRITSAPELPQLMRESADELVRRVTGNASASSGGAIRSIHAERELELGVSALERGDWRSATNHLDAALAIAPDLAEVHYYLALSTWWSTVNIQEVHRQIDLAMQGQLAPAQREFLTGLRLLVVNDNPAALQVFRRAAERFPADRDILYGLFEAAFHGGSPDEAIEVYRRLREHLPRFQLGLMHPLAYYMSRGDQAGAEWALSRLENGHRLWSVRAQNARRDRQGALELLSGYLSEPSLSNNERRSLTVDRIKLELMSGNHTVANELLGQVGKRPRIRWALALTQGRPDATLRNKIIADVLADPRPMSEDPDLYVVSVADALQGARSEQQQSRDALDQLPLWVRRGYLARVSATLLDASLGHWDRVEMAADSPVAEQASLAAGLLAERAGNARRAAELFAEATTHSSDGRMRPLEHLLWARAALADDRLAEVSHACTEATEPTLFDWTWSAVVGPCLLLDGQAALRAGNRRRAVERFTRLIEQRRHAPANDALVIAARDGLAEALRSR